MTEGVGLGLLADLVAAVGPSPRDLLRETLGAAAQDEDDAGDGRG
jgi:hypothetical protein